MHELRPAAASIGGQAGYRAIGDLVQEDRVHRSVYEDPQIFAMEMSQIFGRAWLYVAHESQVPKPGDYLTTFLGLQPVIVTRDEDGHVHVLHNRCSHRGALVCAELAGNTGRRLRCAYHGWSFRLNGDLHSIPLKDGYPESYDLKGKEFGLTPVGRTAIYRGFIFASLDREAPDFDLPPSIRDCFDLLFDRSPEGEIEIVGGVQKYQFRGNWKAQIENACDHYHPPYSHESTIAERGRQFQRREGEREGSQLVGSIGGRSIWDLAGTWAFDHGHGYIGPMPGAADDKSGPIFEKYRAALSRRWNKEQLEEVLKREIFHNVILYPNMNVQLRAQHIRVVRPIAVNRTEVRVYPIKLKGAPEEMYHQQIRFLNFTHSPASLIQTDDLEMFRRIDVGLRSTQPEWVFLGRGYGMEQPDRGGFKGEGTSELEMRNQYKAWKKYMLAA